MIEHLRGEGVTDERVLGAMAEIPRHAFVDEGIASRAYEDMALPIGHGQTISSPTIVGIMTQLLLEKRRWTRCSRSAPAAATRPRCSAQPGEGGLHARAHRAADGQGAPPPARPALLQHPLQARRRARGLSRGRALRRHPHRRPRRRHVPPELKEQLAVGGRMVLPVGIDDQWLYVVDRTENGFVETKRDAVRFVPLLHGTRMRLSARLRCWRVLLAAARCARAARARRRARPRARPPPVVAPPPPAREAGSQRSPLPTHTVKRGETLVGIALQYGLDYRELAAWNNITNLNVISRGPGARRWRAGGASGATPAGDRHRVGHHAARHARHADRGAPARQHATGQGRAAWPEGAVLRPALAQISDAEATAGAPHRRRRAGFPVPAPSAGAVRARARAARDARTPIARTWTGCGP